MEVDHGDVDSRVGNSTVHHYSFSFAIFAVHQALAMLAMPRKRCQKTVDRWMTISYHGEQMESLTMKILDNDDVLQFVTLQSTLPNITEYYY